MPHQTQPTLIDTFGMTMPGRILNPTDYRYGFNGMEIDNEVTGNNSHLDFGARIYDSRIGRWLSVDPFSAKYTAWSSYHFGYNSPIITIDPDGRENIVIIGAQHDESSGNKLMFAHQALTKLSNYKTNENSESRTLVIFTQSYTPDQLDAIKAEAEKLGANIIEVETAEELTNYLNSRDIETMEMTAERDGDLITNVDMYSHGIVGSIEFAFELKSADDARFDADVVKALDPGAFGEDAIVCSYACRTGLGNSDIFTFMYPWESLEMDNSLAQFIADHAGVTVQAYLRRSDYSNTLSSTEDRALLKIHDWGLVPDNVASYIWYRSWQKRLANRKEIDGATFDPAGAVHPVESGDSPYGVPDGMYMFTPSTDQSAEE